jgi:hypothetical protein
MINNYPYRFKTEQEFINEYGGKFRYNYYLDIQIQSCWSENMDYLFGKLYPFVISEFDLKNKLLYMDDYLIKSFMLTKNVIKPTYKPKKLYID